jgi:hypothetical protein
MDFTPFMNFAVGTTILVFTPVAYMVASKIEALAKEKLNITLTQQEQDEIDRAIDVGVGALRANLVAGHMALSDIHVSNPHVDEAASKALDILYDVAAASHLNKEDIAHMIVGQLGHYLGDDPQVPTIAPVPSTPSVN